MRYKRLMCYCHMVLCPVLMQQAALSRVTLVGDIVDVDDDDELIQLK